MDPTVRSPRHFALYVVQTLRAAGFESLWAGGCVRDELLGVQPKDYDVATNALPEQVRECFGYRRTLALGAAFGVITVRGRRDEGMVEVATFRCDATYSDGRHPDSVSFSTAREDALRRDFTMNGLFFDPIACEVIDYVGGRQDLEAGIVRAIGDPHQRIAEDKLRMLRAVRFATTFGFRIEPQTMSAVQQQACHIQVVSAERIAEELRKMLVHPRRAVAARLLVESRLLDVILPESRDVFPHDTRDAADAAGFLLPAIGILERLTQPTFRVALAAFLWGIYQQAAQSERAITQIGTRWKLSNHEQQGALWLLAHEALVRRATAIPWPRMQRILIDPSAPELLDLAEAVAGYLQEPVEPVEFCREKLRLPSAELNPPPLITGDDLCAAGLEAGPLFRTLLDAVRDAQLDGRIGSHAEALQLACELAQHHCQ